MASQAVGQSERLTSASSGSWFEGVSSLQKLGEPGEGNFARAAQDEVEFERRGKDE